MTGFDQDLGSQETKAMVDRDMNEGRQIGINVTPTVFIDGKQIESKRNEDITDMIETEFNKDSVGSKMNT